MFRALKSTCEQCSFHPGWLFDIGDYVTTQLYGDDNKPMLRIPINQSGFHGMSRVTGFFVHAAKNLVMKTGVTVFWH